MFSLFASETEFIEIIPAGTFKTEMVPTING